MRQMMDQESKSRDRQYAELGEQYGKLQSIIDSPAERLSRFIASAAIFFRVGTDEFVDGEEAERQLEQLAELLADNDLRVRVVGHTDHRGTDATNRILALNRAERVAQGLISLKVEPSRLVIVSRSASIPIADKIGTTNAANRRVTFEYVFESEPTE
jgi:outer membrane protein OmpA-like peptidoglycan-associated protein